MAETPKDKDEAKAGYLKWVERHASLFGFYSEDALRTIVDWAGLFQRSGYTAEELEEATDYLAFNGGDKVPYPADQMFAMRDHIQERRLAAKHAQDRLERARVRIDLLRQRGQQAEADALEAQVFGKDRPGFPRIREAGA